MDVKGKLIKKMAGQFGIDPDAPLPELLESLNDAFDLGLKIASPETTAPEVEKAVLALALEAKAALGRPGAKFFLLEAQPEGKQSMRALVIMG